MEEYLKVERPHCSFRIAYHSDRFYMLILLHEMRVFIYTDNKTGKTLETILSLDILDADKQFKELTGLDPMRCPWIGVQIFFDTNEHNRTRNSTTH